MSDTPTTPPTPELDSILLDLEWEATFGKMTVEKRTKLKQALQEWSDARSKVAVIKAKIEAFRAVPDVRQDFEGEYVEKWLWQQIIELETELKALAPTKGEK